MAFNDKISRSLVLLLTSSSFVWACSNSKPEGASSGSGSTQSAGKTGSDASSGGTPNSPSSDDLGGEDGAQDDPNQDGDTDAPVEFRGCGYDSYNKPGSLLDQTISSASMKFQGLAGNVFNSAYNVSVKGSLAYRVGLGSLSTNSNFTVLSADPPNAREKALEEINKVTGSRIATTVPTTNWPALFEQGEWSDLHCSVFPVARIEEQTKLHRSTVQFEPALPYAVSPLLSKARFEQELPSARHFSNVSARVVSTNNPKLEVGQVLTGSVTITPVSPNANFTDTAGRTITVNASYAYRMEFDFGNHETTNSLGLYKVATYYVKGGRFQVITVETGITDAPTVNYIVE